MISISFNKKLFCVFLYCALLFQKSIFAYDEKTEYNKHQKASNRFFKRLTQKTELREFLYNFNEGNFRDRIDISGLSSRTRIIFIRELTALATQNNIKTLFFTLNNNKIDISLKPTLKQPGDGVIKQIGAYKEISAAIKKYTKKDQKKIALWLKKSRIKKNNLYHNPSNKKIKINKQIDLEIFNFLLDFEVARRLQNNEDENIEKTKAIRDDFDEIIEANQQKLGENINFRVKNWDIRDQGKLDRVPVASAIALALSSTNETDFYQFFDSPHQFKVKNCVFSYGDYNAFQGAVSQEHRKKATKRIITAAKNEELSDTNSTLEQIHQLYLEIFGGSEESSGEEYYTSEDEFSSDSQDTSSDH